MERTQVRGVQIEMNGKASKLDTRILDEILGPTKVTEGACAERRGQVAVTNLDFAHAAARFKI